MDQSPELEGFDPVPKSNVFSRLHNDAHKRKEEKKQPEQSVEEPKRSGPRSKIEEDLLSRQKQTQAKLRAKCAE